MPSNMTLTETLVELSKNQQGSTPNCRSWREGLLVVSECRVTDTILISAVV